jgi:hypothetical protein
VIPGATVVDVDAGALSLWGHATVLAPPAYVPTYLQIIEVHADDSRVLEIAEDSRTFIIETEDRVMPIVEVNRTVPVLYENRTFVVEDDP